MIRLEIGDKAPAFELPVEDSTRINLKRLLGKKVILFFYPKDNTPGCTKEACSFRDNYAAFKEKEVIVLGVSRDSAASHLKFKQKYQLPFSLLIDEDGEVCEAYGVIDKKSMFGKTFLGINRSTFLIDEQGKISAIWRKVKVKEHVEQVLDVIS